MEAIAYILKVNICIMVLYLFYRVFLRKDTFYNHNRFFLLFIVPLAFVFPLIDISFIFPKTHFTVVNDVIQDINRKLSGNQTDYYKYILTVLMGISSILFVRFCLQVSSLILLYRKSEKVSHANYKVITVERNILPFSFARWIFINPKLFSEDELPEIVFHEKLHCKQLHTIDVLLYEILSIVLWFNPFMWLLKRHMKENLEFLTDYNVLKAGFNKKNYQYLLLKVNQNIINLSIVNNLKISHIKKRIIMMNTHKTHKVNLLKFAFLIPLFAVMTLVVNAQEIKEKITTESKSAKATTMIHDFGTVEESGDITTSFFIKNTGDKPLVISSVKPSCGCTVAEWTKEPIMPGEKGEIKVSYGTKGRVAPFDKTIAVKTTDAELSEITLRIKGTVIAKKDTQE